MPVEFPPEKSLAEQAQMVRKIERNRRVATGEVADNIIGKHGKTRFNELIKAFQDGISGEIIGKIFGVSRQRVSQWRQALGRPTFEPYPDVLKRIPTRQRRTTTLI